MLIHLPTAATALRTLLRRPGRFGRRLLVSGSFFVGGQVPAALLVGALRRLDGLVWPEHREVEVREPVFIVSNPRSGTTYLHRLMCLDEERFTWLRLWQTIFPSVAFYRATAAVQRVDARVGAPLNRLVRRSERLFFGGWDGVHNMGFSAAEEEEAYFFLQGLTPAMLMFYPFPEELGHLSLLDEMPASARRRAMEFHRTSIQRHLFANGDARSLLSKNVMSSGRIRSLLATYPDARFVQIVRHPYEAIPSFCSMFAMPWKVHSPEIPNDSDEARYWAKLGVQFYLHTHRQLLDLPPNRVASVTYDQLIADPVATVLHVYEQLGLEASDAFRDRLAQESARRTRSYQRKHTYSLEQFGLRAEDLREELAEVFEHWGFDPAYSADAAE